MHTILYAFEIEQELILNADCHCSDIFKCMKIPFSSLFVLYAAFLNAYTVNCTFYRQLSIGIMIPKISPPFLKFSMPCYLKF